MKRTPARRKKVVAAPRRARAVSAPRCPAIAAALQPYIDKGWIAGVVALVAERDRVLSLDAVGFSNIEKKRRMTTDAMFWIASMTKPMTATLLMMLVDEGKVALDDPVGKYIPELAKPWVVAERDTEHVTLRPATRVMTVRDLLRHTSGMVFTSGLERPTLDAHTIADGVLSYAITPLEYEPGTKYAYSNAGINTAGRIVELVSGMDFETFLDKRLLRPLAMRETTFRPTTAQEKRIVTPHRPDSTQTKLEPTKIQQLRYPLSDRRHRHGFPAGGLISTAWDVARFCRLFAGRGVFEGKRLLTEGAVAEMTRTQTGPGFERECGLGFHTDGGVVGHGGALATNMGIHSASGLITVYMVQHAGFVAQGANGLGAFRDEAHRQFRPPL